MLKLAKDFDFGTSIGMSIQGWVAHDPETDIHMSRSYGRRKYGRPTRYCVSNTIRTPENNYGILFRLTAFTDEEALDKANARLAKLAHARAKAWALGLELP